MRFNIYYKDIKVFLSEVSKDAEPIRDQVCDVLKKAGIEVLTIGNESFSNKQNFLRKTRDAIDKANCSIHILGNTYQDNILAANGQSGAEIQFNEVKNKITKDNENFKMFIWRPDIEFPANIEPQQQNFINAIRNGIYRNMIYSTKSSAVTFVEDIRSVMNAMEYKEDISKDTDLFFIHNEKDSDEATSITTMLEDVANLERLNISQNKKNNYLEHVVNHMKRTKLGVIYFSKAPDWALPFVQQVWKLTGGASSTTPLLLVGDSSNTGNNDKTFHAPNVINKIVDKELIPLEIKVHFDNITADQ